MRLSDFDYELPPELIAQTPLAERDAARMLVVDRAAQSWRDATFRDLPSYLKPGDCVVLNESRVIPSRLFGRTESGARVRVLLLESQGALEWNVLVRPGRRLLPRRLIDFGEGLTAEVIRVDERGERLMRFSGVGDDTELLKLLDRLGHVPLPPYIHREDRPEDRERYQTVFAREPGSVAAPTAGLHFTEAIMRRIEDAGAAIARVALHVGLGTFQPIDREDFEQHRLHRERYQVSPNAWDAIAGADRVVAVGTTSVRTVESVGRTGELRGSTELFLYPGARFERVDAMLTNFHLPQSSLLLLVCAFGGTDLMLDAYRHAVREKYRFFSYGDCMLII